MWDKFHLICTQVYIQDSGPGQKGSRIQDWDEVRLELLPGCKCHSQNQKPRHRKEGEEGEVIGQRDRKPGSETQDEKYEAQAPASRLWVMGEHGVWRGSDV